MDVFNDEKLDFKYFPRNIPITREQMDHYFDTSQKQSAQMRLLSDGIRINQDKGESGFICVICDVKFANFGEVKEHCEVKHKEPEEMLRWTPCKPVVGLEMVVEYRNHRHSIVQYECTLCTLFFNKDNIFWHVISYPHKQRFVEIKYPNDQINQISNPNLKKQKIDELLIEMHEKPSRDRGHFRRRTFEPGMVESVTGAQHLTKLNMKFIQRNYPTETNKLNVIYAKDSRLINPLKEQVQLIITNDEEFQRGTELLQKMNKALVRFSNSIR